jgi:hypothetical protein
VNRQEISYGVFDWIRLSENGALLKPGREFLCFIKDSKFCDQLNDWQVLSKNYAVWRWSELVKKITAKLYGNCASLKPDFHVMDTFF